MTFGWGILIGALGTISVETIVVVVCAVVIQTKKTQ